MRTLLPIALIVGLAGALPNPASAQDLLDQAQAGTKVEPGQAKPAPEKATPEKPAPDRLPAFTATNIQIEITLTDQLGTATPTKKTVSLITSDGTPGRIRSGADSFADGIGRLPVTLNIDAIPTLRGDSIRLNLTIEYRPMKTIVDNKPDSTSTTSLNQSLTVMMTSGKSLIVSQAADPVTDRKIVVEAKATILK